MNAPVARRPRFLDQVPLTATPELARFASLGQPAPPAPPIALPEPLPAVPGEAERAALAEQARREALQQVVAAVEALRAQADRLAEQARADAIEIGFQVARKVLEAELRAGPEALFALVRSAVRRAGESRRVSVRLAPEDLALLQPEGGKGAIDSLTAARVEWVADPSLQRGDCLVDTDFGQVDGRLATRFDEIRRAVDGLEGAA